MLTEEIVASRIRAIRVANNYSQFYMAYKLGISQNTFSKIEIGNVKLTLSRLIDIAKVLEIAPDELLKYQPEPKLEIGG